MEGLGLSTTLVLSLLAAFVGVAMLSGTLGALVLSGMSPERKRLKTIALDKPRTAADAPSLAHAANPRLKSLASLLPKSPSEMSRLRRRLARAGLYESSAPVIFSASEVVSAVVFGVIPIAVLGLAQGLMFGAFSAVVGYMLPSMWLMRRIERRGRELQNGLPDALDLLVVCLEAGSAIDQSILKASEELAIVYPALAQEFKILLTETRAGKSRLDAFRNLAERTKVDDVRSLVAMLIQTDRFGTSVSAALKTHAEVSRTKRRQRAEERAAKIGVKLVFPLVLCLFPALYVVILGPAVIAFIRIWPTVGAK